MQFCLLLLMLQVEYGLLEPRASFPVRRKSELRGQMVLLSLADIRKQTRLTFNFCYLRGLSSLLPTKGSNLRLLSDQLIALHGRQLFVKRHLSSKAGSFGVDTSKLSR